MAPGRVNLTISTMPLEPWSQKRCQPQNGCAGDSGQSDDVDELFLRCCSAWQLEPGENAVIEARAGGSYTPCGARAELPSSSRRFQFPVHFRAYAGE